MDAIIELDKKYPGNVHLVLVGEGEELEGWRQRYDHHNFIRFTGFLDQKEISSILVESDVAVLPTYYKAESMPNSIIEYLAHSKPVIASDIGSIRYMLSTEEGDVAGTLIPMQGDTIDQNELIKAIELYIEQPGLISEKAVIAKKAFEKFDANQNAAKYLELFQPIILTPEKQTA